MGKFFSTDGKLYKFMNRFTDILKVNFLWILCSLPVITLGAATIAAFTVSLQMAEDREGHVGRDFLKAFKDNFKQGIPMSLITLFGVYSIYLNFQIVMVSDSPFFLIIAIISAYFIVLSLIYAYPLLARYENTVFNSLRNSFRVSMRHFLRTIFVLVLIAIEIAIAFWSYTTMFIAFLIGPAFIIFTISGPAMAIFRIIDKNSGYEDDE